jgi:hypothetical protein
MREFNALWNELSERAQRWVLSGRMTLEEACYLTEHDENADAPTISEDHADHCMDLAHGRHREQLVARCPEIAEPLPNKEELDTVLKAMPERIRKLFLNGQLTLAQTLYAAIRGLRGIVLDQFVQIRGREPDDVLTEKVRRSFERLAFLAELTVSGMLDKNVANQLSRWGTSIEGLQIYVEATSRANAMSEAQS